ncbi:putative inorganic phosphate cotransporter [Episyrphus balteatus]|uniref:putative inorganic phosphate cotransporter n=1 Tax=Episyrphus balteatus TaxID=286459 RepID=UPI0024855BF5|nr:putative inorganic phosphate cotransporter [Episyrphus balteatus]
MTGTKGPLIGARHLQTLLLYLTLVVNLISRHSIAVTLVAMTDAQTTNPNFPEFDWDEKQKSYILSSFFWGYIVSQIPGGYAARRFGVKVCTLIGTFGSAILGLSVPFCVVWGGWQIFCAIRVLQGLCQGIIYPCVYQQIAMWSPVEERNLLGALTQTGVESGTIVSMYVTGIIAASDLGWPGISYIFSGAGVPRKAEKYKSSMEGHTTSGPFISYLVVQTFDSWGFATMQAQIPAYLHGVLKMEITKNALYSALPYVATFVLAFTFMISADVILKNKWVSLLVLRKIFSTIAMWGSAAFLIGIGFLSETQTALAITFLTLNVGLASASVIGSLLNLIDLSPNHSGILMGFTNTLLNVVPILSPIVVGLIVNDATDRSQWQIVFLISAGFYFLGNLQYLFFAQTDVQPWDSEDYMTKCDTERGDKMTQAPVRDN